MSLQLYSKIPGTQVKRDANLSNAMVQCDPTARYPLGATQAGVPLNKENLAGKLGVEHDICNLDLNNLTVNGVLKVKGPAEVCDIVCPIDFTVTAGRDVGVTSTRSLVLNSGSRGVSMNFLDSSTSNLKMSVGGIDTQADAPTTATLGNIGALGTGGSVTRRLVLNLTGYDFSAGGQNLAPGDVTPNFIYFNDKIVAESIVLITYNSQGPINTDGDVHLDVQLVTVGGGQVSLRFINVGSGTQTSDITTAGFLNVLVIN